MPYQKISTFNVDEFKKPQVLEGRDAIGSLLLNLIQLEPGTYSNFPEMGVGIVSNYRNCDEETAAKLKDHIAEQIATYLPIYQAVQIDTNLLDGNLVIDITIDGVLYKYQTVQQEDNKITGIESLL